MTRPKRREYGTGSLHQRKDGIWIGTVEDGWTADGKRKRRTVSSKSKDEARRRLRDLVRQLDDGDRGVDGRMTVRSWSEIWLPMAERSLAPGSLTSARSAVTRWIVPTIGHRRLSQLQPSDVRAVSEALRLAGTSDNTRRRYHSVLMQLLKAAWQEGHVVPQRVLAVKPPPIGRGDQQSMTVSEAVAVLDQAASLPHGSRFVAALLQGMRQAECLGLTWDEVDLERRTLTVSWQLKPIPYRVKRDPSSGFRVPDGFEYRHVQGALCLTRPKSAAGLRTIPIVPWMATALHEWRSIAPVNPTGLVWPNLDGSPTTAAADDEEWYALQGTAEVGHPDGRWYGIHEARHTTATLLLEAGVDPAVVIAILGQSALIRTYQHPERTQLAARALDRVAEQLRLSPPGDA